MDGHFGNIRQPQVLTIRGLKLKFSSKCPIGLNRPGESGDFLM
jgi:hypothetical protein